MNRYGVFALLLIVSSAATASAQDWARKMFKTTEHDFGVVARGAKAEFAFELTNLYKEDIHIASVQASCGCTTPSITRDTLKTWETGAVVATYNTKSFTGQKNATITVVIDRPFYAEVQLQVAGYIRSDVVFDPGSVQFGEVPQSTPMQQRVRVAYAGRSDWRIVDIRSANTNFEVELSELGRSAGRVDYEMVVRLKPTAPPGYINDQLILVTDDQRMKTVALPVEGRVVSPLTVSPASLFMGVVKPGEQVTKQLVVRGNAPFKVLDIKCEDAAFEFQPSDEAKKLHIIPITFTAGSQTGSVSQTIEIITDLGSGASASCVATATVQQ